MTFAAEVAVFPLKNEKCRGMAFGKRAHHGLCKIFVASPMVLILYIPSASLNFPFLVWTGRENKATYHDHVVFGRRLCDFEWLAPIRCSLLWNVRLKREKRSAVPDMNHCETPVHVMPNGSVNVGTRSDENGRPSERKSKLLR